MDSRGQRQNCGDSRGGASHSSISCMPVVPVFSLPILSLSSTEFFAGVQQVCHLLNEGSEPEKLVSAGGIQEPGESSLHC